MSFAGKYELTSSENFDEYMKAVGVGFATRKVAGSFKPVVTIAQNGDTVTYKTESPLKNTEISFKFGEQFDEETADGRKCKSVIKADNNVWTHEQNCDGKVYVMTREFVGDEMKMVLNADSVVSKRNYKKAL